mgnify:CR=1 FL=1
MLMPKRVKFRRMQRGRMTGKATRGNTVSYGEYGLMALEPGWVKSNQIEAARIAMTRYTKRGGQVWIKIFPDKPYSKKGLGTRMGSGKGAPEGWVAVVKNQKVMFEIGGVTEDVAREALRLAQHKLPIKTRIITKEVETEIGGE